MGAPQRFETPRNADIYPPLKDWPFYESVKFLNKSSLWIGALIHHPLIQYSVYQKKDLVGPGDDIWQTPLPLDRHQGGPVTPPSKHAVTYGDYFQAIGAFLETDHFKMVADAVSCHSVVPPRDIEKIHIRADEINLGIHQALKYRVRTLFRGE